MPDSAALLLSRVDTLLREIGRVEKPLEHLVLDEFDADLRERVAGRLGQALDRHRDTLEAMRAGIGPGESLQDRWRALAKVDGSLPTVFGECLAFLEGALARQHALDNGLCANADALLDELSRRSGVLWDRFTILAEGERYTGVSNMIRLRFSETSIWNLPVAAHEFGHYVGPKLEVEGGRPFGEVLKREGTASPRRGRYVHETFADIFATYALGPAYAFACLLRFNPSRAHADEETHPATGKRLRAILATLKRMDGPELGVFAGICGEIEGAWDDTLAAAGQAGRGEAGAMPAGELALADLDAWAEELYGIVKDGVNTPGRFGAARWLQAQQLSAQMVADRAKFKDQLPSLREEATLAEVINAAWHARWTDWEGAADYGRAAFELCNELRDGGEG